MGCGLETEQRAGTSSCPVGPGKSEGRCWVSGVTRMTPTHPSRRKWRETELPIWLCLAADPAGSSDILVAMCMAEDLGQAGGIPMAADATLVLRRLVDGDSNAAEELLPLVYEHLRALAGSYFRGQPGDHTLQPTALVHEAYLKLINQTGAARGGWNDRAHFLAVAATAMRQVLKDSARRRNAIKRGGEAGERVNLTDVQTPSGGGG